MTFISLDFLENKFNLKRLMYFYSLYIYRALYLKREHAAKNFVKLFYIYQ